MGYFRNPEIRRELVFWSAVLLVPAIGGRTCNFADGDSEIDAKISSSGKDATER